MGERSRVAMIGAGGMANRVHYPSLYELEDAEMVAVCDLDEERLRATADKYEIDGRYTDYKRMIEEIAPGAKSTCGLSNISNGPPDNLRPILNQTYMVMLQRYGMHSVIADPLDDQLIAIAKGQRQDIVDLIYGVMDGNEPDMGSLSKEMQDYVKTVNVILGNTLYSDSWLEI